MKNHNENTNAFLIHISSFAGYMFPFGSIITPLILWQTLKEKSSFLDKHGKEAINFNISYALYIFIISASFISFFFRSFFDVLNTTFLDVNYSFSYHNSFNFFGIASAVGLITLIKVALIIIASMKANNGESYKYPFTINFLK